MQAGPEGMGPSPEELGTDESGRIKDPREAELMAEAENQYREIARIGALAKEAAEKLPIGVTLRAEFLGRSQEVDTPLNEEMFKAAQQEAEKQQKIYQRNSNLADVLIQSAVMDRDIKFSWEAKDPLLLDILDYKINTTDENGNRIPRMPGLSYKSDESGITVSLKR